MKLDHTASKHIYQVILGILVRPIPDSWAPPYKITDLTKSSESICEIRESECADLRVLQIHQRPHGSIVEIRS